MFFNICIDNSCCCKGLHLNFWKNPRYASDVKDISRRLMCEKRLWKSEISSKDAGPYSQVVFTHLIGKNQVPGFSKSGKLIWNGLNTFQILLQWLCCSFVPTVSFVVILLGLLSFLVNRYRFNLTLTVANIVTHYLLIRLRVCL